jgi:mannose-binding lectin 2
MGRIVRHAFLLGAATLVSSQPNLAQTFKIDADQSFAAPFDEISAYTGMRDLSAFEVGGSAVVHRNFLRLTGERQSQKGWVASRMPLAAPEWTALLELRASGTSMHLYGDGLAIWLVANPDHIEGPVFGREDHWTGVGIFFDTFQNLDHSHHHKHPYIYAVVNDGTKGYIPDAEKPDPAKQALPGSVDNSGCSFEFRYFEPRHDVSVLNHTRVHVTYKDKTLKLRLQQTALGERGEWLDCFEMKDVELPPSPYFGISSATGDLVDNHDIVQFTVGSLEGVADPIAHHESWVNAQDAQERAILEEFDLRPAEATQRDYSRVLRAQAAAIKGLTSDVNKLKQSMEFQLASLTDGLMVTKSNVDDKSADLREVEQKLAKQDEEKDEAKENTAQVEAIKEEIKKEVLAAGSSHRSPFFFLFLLILALAGVGYNRYRKIMKSHYL